VTILQFILWSVVKVAVVTVVMLLAVAYTVLLERKLVGRIQNRWGPNRVGWYGVLQPLVDGAKSFMKEDIIPDKADRAMFIIAPALSMIASVVVFAAISFYPGALFTFPKAFPIVGGLPFTGFITNMNVGLLFILGIASVGVYGIVLGAWASNSKFALLGSIRGLGASALRDS